MQNRPYQTQAEDAVISELDKGVRRQMLVMATGTGKTIVFSKLFERLKSRLPGKMLILAHTEELVEQNLTKAQIVNPAFKVGKEMAGEYADLDSDIVSASVQTLGRAGTKRIERFDWGQFDKVVVDEAHHSVTDGYKRILDATGVLAPDSGKLLLGVTATPNRPDGTPLSDLFEKVSFVYSIRQAIKDGWLVDIKGFRIKTTTSLDAIAKTGTDFVASELSKAVNNPQRNQQIVDVWERKASDRQTLAFTVDIQHARSLAQTFQDRGVKAEAVWGEDPDRAEKLRLFHERKIQVLCNCSVLTEGFDDWTIDCVLLARPTQSPILFTQMVGRGTRLDPSFGNIRDSKYWSDGLFIPCTKSDCIVIDIVDGSSKHSLITLPTLMGLQNCLDLHGESLLNTVEGLEALQEEYPNVDFSKLDDMANAKTLIESVDMFQIRFPKEVDNNSDLTWFRAIGGGFKMNIPTKFKEKGEIRVFENALGRWQIEGKINDEKFHGVRPSVEDIFKVADEQVRQRVSPLTLSLVKREAKWHGNPVTKGQKTMLERIFPHKKFNYEQMNAGDASRVIAERLSRRK